MPTLSNWQVYIDGLSLGPGTPYVVHGIEGLGISDVRSNDTPRAGEHGDYPGQDSISSKRLTINITVTGSTSEETIENLDALLGVWYLRSGEDRRPIEFKLPGREQMWVNGRPRRAAPDSFDRLKTRRIGVALEYYAPDPTLYSATLSTLEATLPTSTSGATFPLTFAITFGGGTSGILSVVNTGNFPVRPVLRIYGPCTNPRIEHVDQSRELEFSITLGTSDFLEVDTDLKSVLLNGTASRRSTLVAGSKWFDLTPGDNPIRFAASAYDSAAILEVAWRSGQAG